MDERALSGRQPRLVLAQLARERHRSVAREELAANQIDTRVLSLRDSLPKPTRP